MFIGRHFLFTSLDTSAVGCVVQPQHLEKSNRRNFRVWNSHRQHDHVTIPIPEAAFLAVRFYSFLLVALH